LLCFFIKYVYIGEINGYTHKELFTNANLKGEKYMSTEKKKISLQEAMKQQLANKQAKQEANNDKSNWNGSANQTMKSQQTKKASNLRKRQGV
jgi:glutamyl/glutaminyl-tRNA synthetase